MENRQFIKADLRKYTTHLDDKLNELGLQMTHEAREFYLLYSVAGLSMPIPEKFTEPVQKVN